MVDTYFVFHIPFHLNLIQFMHRRVIKIDGLYAPLGAIYHISFDKFYYWVNEIPL